MTIPVLVQVPLDDSATLDDLVQSVEGAMPAGTAHPFDGETVAQVVILLGGAAFPYFRTWVLGRMAARKGFKVVINGVELSGYTAEEVATILEYAKREIEGDNGTQPGA